MRFVSEAYDGVILVCHDCGLSGAPILLEHIAIELKKRNIPVVFVVRKYGRLLKDYCKIAPTILAESSVQFEKVSKYLSRKGYTKLLCNSAVNADCHAESNPLITQRVLLVHELPKIIAEKNIEVYCAEAPRRFDTLVFPSNIVKREFENFCKYFDNYLILPQAIYQSFSSYKKGEALSVLNKSIKLKDCKKPIVLGVGYGDERKGFDLFLELSGVQQQLNWIWVGDYKKEILNKIENNNDNLYLAGFVKDASLLGACYEAASVFALTSREDPFPSVVMEAFDAGTPVVGFRGAGGFEDIVIEGKTGRLVEYENILEFGNTVVSLAQDSSLLSSMRENCKNYTRQNTFTDYVDHLIKLLFCE